MQFRFSIRTAFLLVLTAAVACLPKVLSLRMQAMRESAISDLIGRGAGLVFDEKDTLRVPDWDCRMFTKEYPKLTRIIWDGTRAHHILLELTKADGFEQKRGDSIEVFSNEIREASISADMVSARTLEKFLSLCNIRSLRLQGFDLTLPSMDQISKYQSLHQLELMNTRIEADLFSFPSSLRELVIQPPPILRPSQVERLMLNLKDLRELRALKLNGQNVTDSHISQLVTSSQSLQKIELAGTAVTDKALLRLTEVKTLQMVVLSTDRCQCPFGVSPDGVDAMRSLRMDIILIGAPQISPRFQAVPTVRPELCNAPINDFTAGNYLSRCFNSP
ncbi:MAG: hypothetical protein KDB14_20760 [Planctomycetales bacterium]|nr:hypothetical protein [Planctomycetales bacterium]